MNKQQAGSIGGRRFQYRNEKGILCIEDTETGRVYRLSMPHEVVEICNLLNTAVEDADNDQNTGR